MNILIQLDLLLINLVVNKDMQLLNLYLEKVLIQLLISGPTNLKVDESVKLIKVETANEMLVATQDNLPDRCSNFFSSSS